LSLGRCFILLGAITLFLISGAAWGQSRPPTAPGADRHLKSDKGDVKSSLEDPREPRLKDWPEQPARIQKNQAGRLRELTPKELREQPVRAQEDLGSRPLKYKQVLKANSTVTRFKKPGAEKSTSGAHQDWSGPKAESTWWPSSPQPAQPYLDLTPLELSLQQYLEKDSLAEEKRSMPEEDEADQRLEEIEQLPKELQKLIKSKVGPQNTLLKED
jgi:hypothetical protein